MKKKLIFGITSLGIGRSRKSSYRYSKQITRKI